VSWSGFKAALFRQIDLRLPTGLLQDIVTRHGAQPWFVYAHANRRQRKHVWWPSLWLAARLPSNAAILETGCGCGLNLLWFAQHGFQRLSGFDIDEKAIAVGRELFECQGLDARLWIDNGLHPTGPVQGPFDAILALNWTYHLDEFDLGEFLQWYRPHLHAGSLMVLDLIDNSYNTVPNNLYLTSDWEKPEPLRRPTEYRKRHSLMEVCRLAKECGYRVIRAEGCFPKGAGPPRQVLVLKFRGH
jgi:hypothetical protein